jgi:hypothetical protein
VAGPAAETRRAGRVTDSSTELLHTKGMTMNEHVNAGTGARNLWMRALFMLLMLLAYQVSVTLLFILAAIQFLIVLVNDAPNVRLMSFGHSVGTYLKQIVQFLSFATEEAPFPFSDWPSSD